MRMGKNVTSRAQGGGRGHGAFGVVGREKAQQSISFEPRVHSVSGTDFFESPLCHPA